MKSRSESEASGFSTTARASASEMAPRSPPHATTTFIRLLTRSAMPSAVSSGSNPPTTMMRATSAAT